MLVVGMTAQVFGGGGYGVAVRTEYQATGDTTLGLELTGGVASQQSKDSDGNIFRSGLIAARGYGRYSVGDHAALTYGTGLAVLGSGAVTAQLHGGVLVGYTNDNAIPVAQLSVALAVPFIEGRRYGDAPLRLAGLAFGGAPQDLPPPGTRKWKPPPERFRALRTELFIAADVGLIIPIGDVHNASFDFGLAFAARAKDIMMSLSFADAYDQRTP